MAKRITVVGSGAVGCFYGGMLSLAGHSVTLVARELKHQEITKHGLILNCEKLGINEKVMPIKVSTKYECVNNSDLILLSVKSKDTKTTIQQISSFLHPSTPIVRSGHFLLQ
jgi:2-dehydropantoate 2-reductase